MKYTSIVFLLSLCSSLAYAEYQKPPPEIEEVLNAHLLPVPLINPTRDAVLFASQVRYPDISVLAEPMLRLAGLRINPLTNGKSEYPIFANAISIKSLPDGTVEEIKLPGTKMPRLMHFNWNSVGTAFTFNNETKQGTELWVFDKKSAKARPLPGVKLNTVLGREAIWLADHESLLLKMIPAGRRSPPVEDEIPSPHIEDASGVAAASSTYEQKDLLRTPHDEDLFEYYTRSQLAIVHTRTGKVHPIGLPDIYGAVLVAPDGRHLLVERYHRPFSFKRPFSRFPRTLEVWDLQGKLVEKAAELPLADQVPIRGVETGPRGLRWLASRPATYVWVEALDGGNLKNKVPHRDEVFSKAVGGPRRSLFRTEKRFAGFEFIQGGQALVTEYDEDKHWVRVFLVDPEAAEPDLRQVYSLSADDHYHDPGSAAFHLDTDEIARVRRDGDWIYFIGGGATPTGDRPFLDRVNLKTLQTERLFRSDSEHLEHVVAIMDDKAQSLMTQRQAPTEVPNLFLRRVEAPGGDAKQPASGEAFKNWDLHPITQFQDPMPQIRGITQKLVNYQRADGLKLSFTLFLPPGYKEGTKLPTVFYAYPRDYTERDVAAQVTGSTKDFVQFIGATHLFFLLRGYAVLDNVEMPVVGPSEKIYDNYLEQLIADAQAAIKKAVELGVTDPKHVGVLGHSHGAMMTANLLAHSSLFQAGIGRSGAYNKTLTMFGFQNERRPLFEARDVYFKVSPTLHAEEIKRPLLLIHGELDSNPGTTPQQSQLLFEAIRGTGGTARLVTLPYENHGYLAKQSVEQVLYEMVSWFDKYVKGTG